MNEHFYSRRYVTSRGHHKCHIARKTMVLLREVIQILIATKIWHSFQVILNKMYKLTSPK